MPTPSDIATKIRDKGQAILRPRPVRYGLATVLGLFLLFGLAGYFWLPGFAKGKLETLLSQEFNRPVHIESIKISPYALTATINGFSVGQANATGKETTTPLFAFDSLFVDISSQSFFRAIPVVTQIRLVGPRIAVVRLADGNYSISDLVEKWMAPKPPTPTPEFSIANITIEGGSLVLDDQMEQAHHEVTDLSLGIPFIANTPSSVEINVEPKFSAKVDGAPLALNGALRPFAPGQNASVELHVQDFDLMRVFQYAPPGLPIQMETGHLNAHLNLEFARAANKSATLRLSGETSLNDIALTRPGGKGHTVRVHLEKAALRLTSATLEGAAQGALALTDLAVSQEGGKEPFLGFASLEVDGIDLSTATRKATVAEVRLTKPFGAARRLKDGSLDIVEVLKAPESTSNKASAPKVAATAKPTAKSSVKAPPPAAQKSAEKKPDAWSWQVGRLAVTEGTLHYADETMDRRARELTANALTVHLNGLTSAPGSLSQLDFGTRINEHGSIGVKGVLGLSPLSADVNLDLTQVDLVALQSWATKDLNAVLTRGEFSAKGHVVSSGPDTSFKGEVSLIDFNVLDKLNSTDLLRWRSLKLSNLDAGSSPPRLGIGEVALNHFFVRAMLTPEGRLNFNDVVRPAEANHTGPIAPLEQGKGDKKTKVTTAELKPTANPTAKAEPKSEKKETADKTPAPKIRIGKIILTDGGVNFTDRFVKPNYTANLTDLNGRIGALTAGTLTDVSVRGKVDRTGTLDISGKVDPLGPVLNLDLHAKAAGIEMAGFSPYSGRYVGYAIEKGKLSVDLRYLVNKGQLQAENNVFLDQLTFGKKVESPDALSIPVNLVVALLKNSRGEIDINLPIKGSLNDPQFSIGGIIGRVILNLLVKAATSPFALLSSLFGGGEELSYVAFEPGRVALTPDAQKHLETLSKALRDRPGLKLELAGAVDPQAEAEGLKRATLDHLVKAQKATELARRGKSSGGVTEITVSAEEYPKYLARVYKASDIKKPRNLIGLAKTLPVEQMETLLMASMTAGQSEMERLALDRGIAVQAWLVEKGGVEQARVFLLAPRVGGEKPKSAPAGGRVDFSLR